MESIPARARQGASPLGFSDLACATARNRLSRTTPIFMTSKQLQSLARAHGTPIVVIDHDVIRKNYAGFKKHLPKVQAYYAVKPNPAPEIVRTLYRAGASFDVASLPEFMTVYE